jgi:hypothetical protein
MSGTERDALSVDARLEYPMEDAMVSRSVLIRMLSTGAVLSKENSS